MVYDVGRQELQVEKSTAPIPLENGRLRLHLLADCRSFEVFGDHGVAYLPLKIEPVPDNHSLEIFARGGRASWRSLEVRELNSIWPPHRK